MQKPQRYEHIDFIRGFAILIMIFIHTSYYFSSHKVIGFFWNYTHFVVPLFIFASSYLFFQRSFVLTRPLYLSYVKKRLTRLLIPYYLYLIIWIVLNSIVGKNISVSYVISSILLIGGNEYNWFILLFVMITLLLPILFFLYQKRKILFSFYTLIALFSSLFLVFVHVPYDYKIIMWLPWSLLPIIALAFIYFEKQRWFYWILAGIAFFVFFLLQRVQIHLHHSLGLYDNKYPPNLYYLSYGIGMLCTVLLLLEHGVGNNKFINTIVYFFSKYSYTIFFIHVSILFILLHVFPFLHFQWWSLYLTVVLLTVIIQIGINTIILRIRSNH